MQIARLSCEIVGPNWPLKLYLYCTSIIILYKYNILYSLIHNVDNFIKKIHNVNTIDYSILTIVI